MSESNPTLSEIKSAVRSEVLKVLTTDQIVTHTHANVHEAGKTTPVSIVKALTHNSTLWARMFIEEAPRIYIGNGQIYYDQPVYDDQGNKIDVERVTIDPTIALEILLQKMATIEANNTHEH